MENQQRVSYEIISKHYYGNSIRVLFLIAGALMIITYPFFNDLIQIPSSISIFLILLLVIFGGLINPVQRWLFLANSIISAIAFAMFEYQTVFIRSGISFDSRAPMFFWINQILALIFFTTTYLSVKTLRGRLVNEVK